MTCATSHGSARSGSSRAIATAALLLCATSRAQDPSIALLGTYDIHSRPGLPAVAAGAVLALVTIGLDHIPGADPALGIEHTAAAALFWPREMAGVRVEFIVRYLGSDTTTPLPIRGVYQERISARECGDFKAPLDLAPPHCIRTYITVQFPHDLRAGDNISWWVVLVQGDRKSGEFRMTPFNALPRAICGSEFVGPPSGFGLQAFGTSWPCDRDYYITRPGSALRIGGPGEGDRRARPGEVLVLHATGLGSAPDGIREGERVAEGIDIPFVKESYLLAFDYIVDREPSRGPGNLLLRHRMGRLIQQPEYVGLKKGEIGVYEVRFTVPEPPAGSPRCPEESDTNLTITLWKPTLSSVGNPMATGARLCIDVENR